MRRRGDEANNGYEGRRGEGMTHFMEREEEEEKRRGKQEKKTTGRGKVGEIRQVLEKEEEVKRRRRRHEANSR